MEKQQSNTEQPIVTICKTPRWQLLKSQVNNLTPEDFKSKIEIKGTIIIDVRTAAEHQISAIPNSINIDYLGEGFWEKMEALDNTKTYLVYCRTGRRSLRVCTLMKNGGFDAEKVFNLDGGMSAWEATFGIV